MDNKPIAIKLRKTGKSYNQIKEILGVPKSTLSYWLKDIKLDKKAQDKIFKRKYQKSTLKLIERNKKQTVVAKEKADRIVLLGKNEFKKYSKESLFTTGVSLYWAEGYKKGAYGSKWKVVDFTNSDEYMIILMMKFFRKYFKINNEKIKIQIIAHPNIDINKAVNKWSVITKIPKKQFIKTFSKPNISSKGVRNKKSLPFGTAHIRIYDVKYFFRIIGWIEGLKKFYKI